MADYSRYLDAEGIRRVSSAPLPVKVVAFALLFLAVFVVGAIISLPSDYASLRSLQQQEETLKKTYEREYQKVANLDEYREQLDQLSSSFGSVRKQLPSALDVESLLIDLSQSASLAGLSVESFAPGSEKTQDFYTELPVKLVLQGSYQQFGAFLQSVSQLSRIITVKSVSIKSAAAQNNQGQSGELQMDMILVTYRYLADDEL